jgi:hypothetical protein
MTDNDERRAELRERLMRYRILERETTDPIASRFLHDIVSELEGDLDAKRPFRNRLSGVQLLVCTENLIRVDDVMESPKLAE